MKYDSGHGDGRSFTIDGEDQERRMLEGIELRVLLGPV